MSEDKPKRQKRCAKVLCAHCGQDRDDHWVLNFADGNLISATVLVCPTAIFKERERVR